ncbi:hypothetical protein [Haladaptatus sp. GCM10025707]|uniref:hypothetical protein n=1 Tax=Haladaptatus sp. GCM10025707 TaxID=3252658 RepID=UPI0036F25B94
MGYSRSGIAKRVGVTEATVVTYLEAVKETFGAQAVETAHPDQLAAWPDCPFFPEAGRDER